MRGLGFYAVFLAVFFASANAHAQSWPSDDGWTAVERGGAILTDPADDAPGAGDIVGDAANPALFVSADALHVFIRLRIDEDPLNAQRTGVQALTWGVLFDTDSNTDGFEGLAMINGVANPIHVALYENTTQGTVGDPQDPAETVVQTYPYATHARVQPADSMFFADPDFFLDFALSWDDLWDVRVIPGNPFRMVVGSGDASGVFTSDVGVLISDEVSDAYDCLAEGCGLAPNSFSLSITSPTNGRFLATSTPALAGLTKPGATVNVVVGGDLVTTTANGTGNWAAVPNALADGEQTATVEATLGGASSDKVSVTFIVDTVPPALSVESPSDGASTPADLTFSGTAEAGASIDVFVDGVQVASARAADDGAWATEATGLPDGSHMVLVVANDIAGNRTEREIRLRVGVPGEGPNIVGEGPDSDGDGLSDAVEAGLGTDPNAPDSDEDGLTDGAEFSIHKTNPLETDTDGDGVQDADEVELGSNPRLVDTDGGGASDGVEATRGTDLLDPADDDGVTSDLAGHGCSSVPSLPNAVWVLAFALLFKRRRRA